jgi:hypothetical protein
MSKAAEKKRRHEKQEKIAMEARARALAHMKTKNVQSHAEIIAPVPKNARNHRDNTLELVRKRKAKQMQAQTVEDVAKKQRLEAATQNANNVPAPAPTPTPTLPPPQASTASSVQTTKVIPKGPTWHEASERETPGIKYGSAKKGYGLPIPPNLPENVTLPEAWTVVEDATSKINMKVIFVLIVMIIISQKKKKKLIHFILHLKMVQIDHITGILKADKHPLTMLN